MTEADADTVDHRGRPRRYDETTERRMLLDAAMSVLTERDYSEMAVADVLAVASLSTRSFYRHFESKDALLRAVFEREVRSVVRHVERAVEQAPDAVAAVGAWIDAVLDTFLDPRRATRSAALTTRTVLSAGPVMGELASVRRDLCRPLADVLRAGHDAGLLESTEPVADAACVFGIVSAAAGARDAAADPRPPRADVRRRIERFVWPALGVTPTG